VSGSNLVDILLSLVAVALVTTLILPGRQTPRVLRAGGAATSDIFRAAMGR
jgi:uncharacterized protein YceH (UPF0502 family)